MKKDCGLCVYGSHLVFCLLQLRKVRWESKSKALDDKFSTRRGNENCFSLCRRQFLAVTTLLAPSLSLSRKLTIEHCQWRVSLLTLEFRERERDSERRRRNRRHFIFNFRFFFFLVDDNSRISSWGDGLMLLSGFGFGFGVVRLDGSASICHVSKDSIIFRATWSGQCCHVGWSGALSRPPSRALTPPPTRGFVCPFIHRGASMVTYLGC